MNSDYPPRQQRSGLSADLSADKTRCT